MILDKKQLEIVNSIEKDIIVVAPAGSGKTRVLTERIRKQILEVGIPASNIVAITFTNNAAEEMRGRLKDIPDIGDAFIGTIHSFANRIYKSSGFKYMILNEKLEEQAYRSVLSSIKFSQSLKFHKWLKYKDLEREVLKFKIPESVLNDFFLPSEKSTLEEVKKDVNLYYKKHNIIGFSKLIKYSKEYFKSINGSLDQLYVDEFQDISSLIYGFIKDLKAKSYFFIGDDYQAIYNFSGGDVEIFTDLIRNSTFTTYYLENNYRSCSAIIDFSEKIIKQVPDLIEKNVEVVNTLTRGNVVRHSKDSIKSVIGILNIKKNYKDFFILTRSNAEIGIILNLLNVNKIPYHTFKGADHTSAEIEDIMKLNTVKVLTTHSAKGLESKNVIIYGNFNIVQPSWFTDFENMKVLYVAVTRAKECIHIYT